MSVKMGSFPADILSTVIQSIIAASSFSIYVLIRNVHFVYHEILR